MLKRNKLTSAAIAGMIVAVCLNGYAAGTKRAPVSVKTVVTSDKLIFDYGKSTCVFEKNVVVDDPRVKMKCDKLYIFFNSTNSVESIVATGSVKVWQENRVAVCDKAVYTEKSGAIVMTGHAKLQQGKNLVQGKEIKIFVNSEKVISTPGRLVVFPSDVQKESARRKRR